MNASQSCVPFIEVVYDSTITEPMLRRLGELLPGLVAEAVACPEERAVGHAEPGDLEIRFRPKGPFDIGALNCAVEVRTKLYSSRIETRQKRAELVTAGVSEALPGSGALVCGWSWQTDGGRRPTNL